MAELKLVPIEKIDPNPFRLLADYPYNPHKLEALERSIADVGLWEGIIARVKSKRYEVAFGHHRLEAARRSGLDKIPLITRDLDDTQMLQFMGRENLEDYNADFLTMLETWEAGIVFCPTLNVGGKSGQPIEIARLLGWTQSRNGELVGQLNHTARACHAAYALIKGGYISRDDLRGMPVSAALEIVERAQIRNEQLDELGKQGQRPAREIEAAKKQVGKGAKETARQHKDGQLAQKDLRGQVDINAYRHAKKSKKVGPLLSVFAKSVADSLAKILKNDATSKKLAQIQEVLSDITLEEDKQVLNRIDFELGELADRSSTWRKRITLPANKIVSLQIATPKED